MKKIILASNSPRRRELMKYIGYEYEVITSNVDEIIDPKLEHDELVMNLAFQKAYDIFKDNKEAVVLGFDTLVIVDDFVLGKPKDTNQAKMYLNLLSNRNHTVITGCSILSKGFSKSFYSTTLVTFTKLSNEEIDEYIKTGEPMDKAGAYGIQGYGSKFVTRIVGDYFTIIGFPISKVYKELNNIMNK